MTIQLGIAVIHLAAFACVFIISCDKDRLVTLGWWCWLATYIESGLWLWVMCQEAK